MESSGSARIATNARPPWFLRSGSRLARVRADHRKRKRRSREQIALAAVNARVAQRAQLVECLDALGDDLRAHVLAELHDARDEPLLPRIARDARDQSAIELDHARLEVGNALEVRV